jgi:HD-GYP domain-containing protein (c-di-GMP phosphodiesterase class II)
MLQSVAAIVRAHHEWMDGSGYPDGLSGEAMPLGARIVAVADAYDTHTARSLAETLNELRTRAGSQFDPRVVEALARLLKT